MKEESNVCRKLDKLRDSAHLLRDVEKAFEEIVKGGLQGRQFHRKCAEVRSTLGSVKETIFEVETSLRHLE